MATHAIMAFKECNKYYAKFVHYGSLDDNRDMLDCDKEEFVESVLQGGSTEPFDGFYLDVKHCLHDLNWNASMYVDCIKDYAVKKLGTFDELKRYAKRESATFIYLFDEKLTVYYRTDEDDFVDYFDEDILVEVMPFNIDNLNDFDFAMIIDELELAYDEVSELLKDDEDALNECGIDVDAIEKCSTKEAAIELCKKFNDALPAIKDKIKERRL